MPIIFKQRSLDDLSFILLVKVKKQRTKGKMEPVTGTATGTV